MKNRSNSELILANDFIQNTDVNIFLTGKAGTGKTTFLKEMQKNSSKRMIITAPTGVAAINAGGVTLHSFFQLPFGPYLQGSSFNKQQKFKFSKEKKRIIQGLDLLVIDEISMVRSDLLDAVDEVLRQHRYSDKPFGGVQLLMIGDLNQLSPVTKSDEWALLKKNYDSVYFFSSSALIKTEMVTIELKHIYRQSDPLFIEILNKIRDNTLDPATVSRLNAQYVDDLAPAIKQGYIMLTTHNNRADSVNSSELSKINKKDFYFKAIVEGDFPEQIFPTYNSLLLKEGARVMFIKNDSSVDKHYYNGKTGVVKTIKKDRITIVCPGDNHEIVVEPIVWDNIKYSINEESKEIEETVMGTFKQYPLKLAWAITIHKSQGMTFDRVIIDSKAAFAHGQVYVAFSRCKTLEGIVLSSPVSPHSIGIDDNIIKFNRELFSDSILKNKLQISKNLYQQKLLLECFSFKRLKKHVGYLTHLFLTNQKNLFVAGVDDIQKEINGPSANIFDVAEKFKLQLNSMFSETILPEMDESVIKRTIDASAWFSARLVMVSEILKNIFIETDNKELQKKINRVLDNVKKETELKLSGVRSCSVGFSLTGYLGAVSVAQMEPSASKRNRSKSKLRSDFSYLEEDVEHYELFENLKEWRSRLSKKENIAPFTILHQRVLILIAVYLPSSKVMLKKINGVGDKTIEKYGPKILEIVTKYRQKHKVERVALPAKSSKSLEAIKQNEIEIEVSKATGDTKSVSFDLLINGLGLNEIAKKRGLTVGTIEGHLCYYIEKGEVSIDSLLLPDKQSSIVKQFDNDPSKRLGDIKENLGSDFSYGEIKMVRANLKYLSR